MTIPRLQAIAPSVVTIAYAASITPNCDTTDILNVGELTGAITINAPTGTKVDGQNLRFRFDQDATGRVITWNAAFLFNTDVPETLIPNSVANAKFEVMTTWHAGDAKWRVMAIVRDNSVPGIEIFDLTVLTALASGDVFPVVDISDTTGDANGTTKKITVSDIVAGLQLLGHPRVKRLNSQHSNSTTTGTKCTDLDMTLEAGTYTFQYVVLMRSATTTVGPMLGVNFTGTGNPRQHFRFADATVALTDETFIMDNQGIKTAGFIAGMADSTKSTTAPAMGTTVGVAATATDILCFIEGIIIVTVSGNLELWHSSETATATTVEIGTSLIVIRTA